MSFRDSTGHVWELTLDLVACRRVRDMVGINMLSMHTGQIFSALADPIIVAEILYAIVRPQAEQLRLTEPDFLRRMAVDTGPIVERLVSKLSDFFRQLGQPLRANQLQMAMERANRLAAMTTPEELTRITTQTFDWMEQQIHQTATQKNTSGDFHMNTPESSESIPISRD